MKKYLITGANGFIGANLIDSFSDDIFVYALGRRQKMADRDNMKFIEVDFSTDWDVSILPKDVDVIIHLVQSEHFREFPEKAADIFAVNTSSTLKLLEYARCEKINKFIYASSGGIYGYGEQQFTEDARYSSNGELGFYLGSKLCSEVLTDSYTQYMDISVLRFFFVYGEGQRETMLVPRLINSVVNQVPIQIRGSREGISLNPIYISDAVASIKASIKLSKSHKINVGGADSLSISQMAEIIGAAVGKNPVFEYQAEEINHSLVGDITKMKSLLHYPSVSFNEGILQLINRMTD